MSTRATLRSVLARNRVLKLPIAHDALSARLIEQAGFPAYSIGGFGLAGSRYALPDVGLASFGEVVAGVRDVMMGSKLPVLVDADEGYGDVKNVVRTVETLESLGAAGMVLEDQASPKRCGHLDGKSVVPVDLAQRKLDAALSARTSPEFFIVARTDALGPLGIDEAIARGRLFAQMGADAVFVEAPTSRAELERIGGELGGLAPLLANMAEGGRTPLTDPEDLADMGFSVIVYPSVLFIRMVRAIRDGCTAIQGNQLGGAGMQMLPADLAEIFGVSKWLAVEQAAASCHAE